MDREIVLLVLLLLVSCPLFLVGGIVRLRPLRARSAVRLERLRWTQLWLTLVPGMFAIAAVLGWALVEPEDAEVVPWVLFAVAGPFLFIALRAVIRGIRALASVPAVKTAATVGLLFPRVVIAPAFASSLDAAALAAASGHELAHARHRDPLRLWLAQFAADLTWPARPARRRLCAWRRSLELARDEEARHVGVDGADLASAVIAALRVTSAHLSDAAFAALTGEETALRQRVRRLLNPLVASEQPTARMLLWLAPAIMVAAAALGASCGEPLVRLLFGGAS